MTLLHNTRTSPTQTPLENVATSPQPYPRTVRTDFQRVLTTGFGGKCIPVMAIPLLREDRLLSSTFRFGFEMAETASMLMNPVRVAVNMWFVPKLASPRFLDLGHLNRAWRGEPESDGSQTDYFNKVNYNAAHEFWKTMGLHAGVGWTVNDDYLEAYNLIWNHMASQVSPSLAHRDMDDVTLAPAFWSHSTLKHVKPTFDQALQWGEVPLTIAEGKMTVKSDEYTQMTSQGGSPGTNALMPAAMDNVPSGTGPYEWNKAGSEIWAELQTNGVTVSLANLELARKTTAFARARQKYQGLNDDALIDMLMAGLRLPEEGMQHPIHLGRGETIYGMTQRYATDGVNLEKSVTRGQTFVDLNISVPQVNTGGVVMATVEILPEQLYERSRDPFFTAADVSSLPNRLQDELDVEPVEVVTNGLVDIRHSDPNGVFGYAPLNHRWQRETPNIGGLYFRNDPNAPWDENRNRIWAVETVDPTLGDDFYLATNIHHNVFVDSLTDPFEISVNGLGRIEGLTFFGPALRESTGDYDAIMAQADTSRITLPES